MGYIPPFELTDEMFLLVSKTVELLGKISNVGDLNKLPKLRRSGRLKSIHSSLAIEKNTLSISQVQDIINGKRVLGPPNEIQEVKNAYDAYQKIDKLNPCDINNLLKIHKIMMEGLLTDAGQLRHGQVGVFGKGGVVIHLAPPPSNVAKLIKELLDWLDNSKTHPLIKSSVFHYEFEFIHPFSDGNGRMGRLWQTVILSEWRPIFAWIPIESIIKERQLDYYTAIKTSTSEGKSNTFIIFMLQAIYDAVKEIANDTGLHLSHTSIRIKELLAVMQDYPMTSNEIMTLLGKKSKVSFLNNYLRPALEADLIGKTYPDKPTSGNQRYFKK